MPSTLIRLFSTCEYSFTKLFERNSASSGVISGIFSERVFTLKLNMPVFFSRSRATKILGFAFSSGVHRGGAGRIIEMPCSSERHSSAPAKADHIENRRTIRRVLRIWWKDSSHSLQTPRSCVERQMPAFSDGGREG